MVARDRPIDWDALKHRLVLDRDVAPLDPAPFTEPCLEVRSAAERLWTDRAGSMNENADLAYPLCRLRCGGERRGEGPRQRAQQEAAAVHYSMT
jgi:hypothetical protein